MSIFNASFPRADIKTYLKIMALIGFSISIILILFQPFGTANFKHDFKYLILSGYGIVVFLVCSLFHILVNQFLSIDRLNSWTVWNEVVCLFVAVVLSLTACYCYVVLVFSQTFNFMSFLYFLGISSSVALIPVAVYSGFIYNKYKEVQRGNLDFEFDEQHSRKKLLISGSNKNEKLELDVHNLLYLKSDNNYVILYCLEEEILKRKMVRNTLSAIEAQLSDDFVRSHRSYLINRTIIEAFHGNKSSASVQLHGIEKKIPVSRAYYESIKKLALK